MSPLPTSQVVAAVAPDIRSDYRMPPVISIIDPISRTNLVTNPSGEIDLTGWSSFVSGTVSRDATASYYGAYSIKFIPGSSPSSAVRYSFTSLPVGTYAVSIRFGAQRGGLRYKLGIIDGNGVELSKKSFVSNAGWQYIWIPHIETGSSPVSREVRIYKDGHASVDPFWVDGAQVELCESGNIYPTTYIDGDQTGESPLEYPPQYFWNGTPHNSTSTRLGTTRSGGRVLRLDRYGFTLRGIHGLGMADHVNTFSQYGLLDGQQLDRTRKAGRVFSLIGRFEGESYQRLRKLRGSLIRLLDRDLIGEDVRPVTLLYTPMNEQGDELGPPITISAYYAGGLGGDESDFFAQDTEIRFESERPDLRGHDSGAALTATSTLANISGIVKRSRDGQWSALATGVSGGAPAVYSILPHTNGTIYVAGDFTAAGASGADFCAIYDPATDSFSRLAGSDTTFNNTVVRLAQHPDGRVILAGTFTNAAGNASADYVCAYTPTTDTISNLGTGGSNSVLSVAVDQVGRIFAGANFATDLGGVAATNGIGYYDTSWHAMGSGLNDGDCQVILPVGNRIYIGGSFTQVNSVANTAHMAYWSFDDSAWHSVTSGAFTGSDIKVMLKLANGSILVSGTFTQIGGVTAAYAAIYNGFSFSSIGGASSLASAAEGGALQPIDNIPWLGGAFGTASGQTIPSPLVQLIGSLVGGTAVYIPAEIDFPGAPTVFAIGAGRDGTMYFGYNFPTPGSATVAGRTTINYTGTSRSYPRVTIICTAGSGKVQQLKNYTNGRSVYFKDLTINSGETITFDFNQRVLRFISTFQGNLAGKIFPGSQESDFFLDPGNNVISLYVESAATVTVFMSWPILHATLDTAGAI